MPWKQFDLPELNGRLQLIAGYLANRLRGRHIIDLNCGAAPLLDWLPRPIEWGWYYGNDTNEDSILQCREKNIWCTTFEAVPDGDVLDRFDENCLDPDILLCLGYAARYHPLESKTLDQTIVKIAAKYRPRAIVLDAWEDITRLPSCGFTALLGTLEEQGYQIVYDWTLEANHATTPYSRRRVVILELP